MRRWFASALGVVKEHPSEEPVQHHSRSHPPGIAEGTKLPSIGDVLGTRYRLDQLIGYGGAAVVYLGYDLELNHQVAIKVLLIDRAISGSAIGRQLRVEARAAMRLSHPIIARVFNYERHDPWEFLVMEFVRGQNLNVLSRSRPNGRFEIRETIHIGLDVLDALSYAHKQDVIHNDITPRNILINQRNEVKLCDFGLSMLIDLQAEQSSKTVLGTVAYISPERLQGGAVDARSDLYSLGATLFKLSVGRPPFGAHSNNGMVVHASDGNDSLLDIPRPFKAILSKALMKDPNGRFTDAAEMGRALLKVLRDLPSDAQIGSEQQSINTVKPSIVPDEKKVQYLRNRHKPPPGMLWVDPRNIEYEGKNFDIKGFYLDRTPVTNMQYAKFVSARRHVAPLWWDGVQPPEDKLDHPVVGITISQARRYAAWCNKRLPTTLEWIAALYGKDNQLLTEVRGMSLSFLGGCW